MTTLFSAYKILYAQKTKSKVRKTKCVVVFVKNEIYY